MLYEKVNIPGNELYVIEEVDGSVDYPYHFHPEYEILFVKNAFGKRIIGGSIEDFAGVDLALLGPGLPHKWKFDKTVRASKVIVIKFRKELINNPLFNISGSESFQQFYGRACGGIIFNSHNEILETGLRMEKLLKMNGMERMLSLISFLFTLTQLKSCSYPNNMSIQLNLREREVQTIDKIYNYIITHFKEDITLDSLADRFNYSKSGFFQLFKRHTGYKISEFIYQLRIEEACRQLTVTDKTIKDICYQSGFQNLSWFNRQFRKVTSISPLHYRKMMHENPRILEGISMMDFNELE